MRRRRSWATECRKRRGCRCSGWNGPNSQLWITASEVGASATCVGVAPACKELRSGPNKSEREPTSARSTHYGSGHLIRVFRDIGHIFSSLYPSLGVLFLSRFAPVPGLVILRQTFARRSRGSSPRPTPSAVTKMTKRTSPLTLRAGASGSSVRVDPSKLGPQGTLTTELKIAAPS